jgi:hypothetical protein
MIWNYTIQIEVRQFISGVYMNPSCAQLIQCRLRLGRSFPGYEPIMRRTCSEQLTMFCGRTGQLVVQPKPACTPWTVRPEEFKEGRREVQCKRRVRNPIRQPGPLPTRRDSSNEEGDTDKSWYGDLTGEYFNRETWTHITVVYLRPPTRAW